MDKLILGTVYLTRGVIYGIVIYGLIFCVGRMANWRKEKCSGALILAVLGAGQLWI